MFSKLRQRYRQTARIRSAIDTYPGGICFAAAGGRPILVNRTMNEVCYDLCGHTVTNAEAMWTEISGLQMRDTFPDESGRKAEAGHRICRRSDGSVWQFQRRSITVNGRELIQYEASDVTELYEYRNRLWENNEKVAKLHERQRELLHHIVQNNMNKELLRAKMQIHDEFGRVLIITKNALEQEDGMKPESELTLAWNRVIEDMEHAMTTAASEEVSPESELLQVAGMIGCRVIFEGRQPSERKALLLLYAAIREALTNAVRHAGAEKLLVEIKEADGGYRVQIRDNGNANAAQIREGGGLGSLRKRLEQEGASMETVCGRGVTLKLWISRE